MNKEANFMKAILLLCLCVTSFSYSLFIGDVSLNIKDIVKIVLGNSDLLKQFVLLHLRLPHTWNVFVIGCLLALSGYLSQIMLNNPLADPYTLGISGGAGVFTLLGMMIGLENHWIILCGFIGSAASMMLLSLAAGDLRQASQTKLLLAGVILAAGWGAALSLLLILSPLMQTKSFLYWLFGDVDSQQLPLFTAFCLVLGLLCSMVLNKELTVLSQGTLVAKTLGINTEKLQLQLFVLSSFLTATAVCIGGTIGFIGLIVPHLGRMLFPRSHSALLMLSIVILGGCLLLVADILARILIEPAQLPVGIITTLLGIPFFIFLSQRDRQC